MSIILDKSEKKEYNTNNVIITKKKKNYVKILIES
jgi:hypothetical protein